MAAPTTAKREQPKGADRSVELTELGLAFKHVFRTLGRLRGRDTHLGPGELSHAQFELLLELQEQGELSAGELAAAARLAPGTVTQMLDALAESGHVERARSERDRRVVVSRLTPLGASRIEAKRKLWQERWEQALEGFAERDLLAAANVLRSLGEMFDATPPAGPCETVSGGSAGEASTGRKPA
jgi:DNA-binding MarR family transcriptional regulator